MKIWIRIVETSAQVNAFDAYSDEIHRTLLEINNFDSIVFVRRCATTWIKSLINGKKKLQKLFTATNEWRFKIVSIEMFSSGFLYSYSKQKFRGLY